MKLSQEVIDDIRKSANIVDVIGHYIPLIKKGKSYSAVCPFHDDHDPSLSISEDKQIYKCFVCGNGGNVFTFVANYTKCSFIDAVVEVSKIIGKPIEVEVAPKKISPYQKYYDLLSSMVTYTNYLLTSSKIGEQALSYLNNRGLDLDVINYFKIGLNPDKNRIYNYLKSQNYKDEDMIKVNVARFIDSGMSDVFYNRITFPIHDENDNVIAFSARDYLNISDSKYINSNENIIYKKSNVLYNLNRAIPAIKKNQYVIICEGVMDVIAYYRANKENVVASLGTAFTNEQLSLIGKYTKNVVLSYDGDNAGKKANMKIGQLLMNNGFNVSVIDNDTLLDPDEIINKYGKNALRDLENKQITYLDYAIKFYKEIYNLNNYNDRKKYAFKIAELINKLNDQYDRDNYFNELFKLTNIRIDAYNGNDSKNNKEVYNNKAANFKFSIDGLTKAEYVILTQIALSHNALDIYQKELGCLLDENNQRLSMLIIDDYRKNGSCSLSRIYDECDDTEIKNIISTFALVDDLSRDYSYEYLLGAINKVKEEIKKIKLENLKKEISKYESVDLEKTKEYLTQYQNLIRDLGGYNGKKKD